MQNKTKEKMWKLRQETLRKAITRRQPPPGTIIYIRNGLYFYRDKRGREHCIG